MHIVRSRDIMRRLAIFMTMIQKSVEIKPGVFLQLTEEPCGFAQGVNTSYCLKVVRVETNHTYNLFNGKDWDEMQAEWEYALELFLPPSPQRQLYLSLVKVHEQQLQDKIGNTKSDRAGWLDK